MVVPTKTLSVSKPEIAILKLGNRCARKFEKATKALFMGFLSCYLSPKVPHGQVIL